MPKPENETSGVIDALETRRRASSSTQKLLLDLHCDNTFLWPQPPLRTAFQEAYTQLNPGVIPATLIPIDTNAKAAAACSRMCFHQYESYPDHVRATLADNKGCLSMRQCNLNCAAHVFGGWGCSFWMQNRVEYEFKEGEKIGYKEGGGWNYGKWLQWNMGFGTGEAIYGPAIQDSVGGWDSAFQRQQQDKCYEDYSPSYTEAMEAARHLWAAQIVVNMAPGPGSWG